ncbi:MAG: AMP-binding protein, partial [Pirellulaceae bacterium]|nr:AMP-binding protein [Pirellulaceae bacterium]
CLSFRKLHERAQAIGSELQALAAPGERAMLLFPPGLEFIPAFFGCLYAGIVAVPVACPGRNRLTSTVLAVFQASKPSLILSTAEHCQQASHAYAHLPSFLERRWIATDQISPDRQAAWRDPQVDPQQTAFLQFTSGSTSSPKGVMLSHANLLYNAALIHAAFGNHRQSSAVFWLPLYHDMGLIGGVLQPLYSGGPCTLLAAAAFLQRPALWLETISRTKATISGGPDFAYDLCTRKVSAQERAALDLSSWAVAFNGAERIRAATLEKFADTFAPCGFRRTSIFPCYGLAEATLIVSGGPRGRQVTTVPLQAEALARNQVREAAPDDATARRLVGCGESLPTQRIVIADLQTGCRCPDDEVGEIWIQGPSVAGGYYEQPETTATVFGGRIADTGEGPFLRTGDLGFLRAGQLFVTGRLKDLIIIRGRNHYPEDIEHSLDGAHPGLRTGYTAAFSVDAEDCERLIIVQEVEPRQRNLDSAEAIQSIRRAVAAHHELEIHAILLVKAGSIPKTSSGKTRRSACRERYLRDELEILASWQAESEDLHAQPRDGRTDLGPRTVTAEEIETWLTNRIAARLQLPPAQVRVSTPFREFGMGSLDAAGIAADLEHWLRRRLSPVAIYNHPSIAALARWLANPPDEESDASAGTSCQRWTTGDIASKHLKEEVSQMSEADLQEFLAQEMAKQSA